MRERRDNIISVKNSEKSREEFKVIVYGCGGHARSVINSIYDIYENAEITLIDDNAKEDEFILGYRAEQEYELQDNDSYIIAVGDNNRRKELYQRLADMGRGCCISVISIYSYIGIDVKIGKGTFIAPNAYIGPQAEIGNNTIINTGSVIEHEVIIGNHTHIAPHATICGRTRIGDNVLCGAGSTIVDKITICDNVIIGAGAVVKENIIKAGTYVGIPARKVK